METIKEPIQDQKPEGVITEKPQEETEENESGNYTRDSYADPTFWDDRFKQSKGFFDWFFISDLYL